MKKICVIGSINADITMRVPRFVQPGETLRGTEVHFFPGGKGANQAVAAARLGGEVYLAGRMGGDPYAAEIMRQFQASGLRREAVEIDPEQSTGTALIQVADDGQNAICIVAGANDTVNPLFLRRVQRYADDCDIMLFQLEIPMETLLYAVKDYHPKGKLIILDPAPAAELHNELLRHVDIITPNETELRQLTGIDPVDDAARLQACEALAARGVKTVLHKAGGKGCYLYHEGGMKHIPSYEVTPVDTTAAGDSFNGALANALARGLSLEEAADFANLVGALSTLALGAQNAMPTMVQAEKAAGRLRKRA